MRLQSPLAAKHASSRSSPIKHSARSVKNTAISKNKNGVDQSDRCSPFRVHDYYKGKKVSEPTPVRPPALSLKDLECVRVLGTGAYGSVLLVRVRHREPDHQYDKPDSLFALKVLQKVDMQNFDAHFPQDTDAERDALIKLPWNPWISGAVDAFHDQINLYLMMECIPAGVLHDLIYRRGPLDATMARFYFANIVCALDFLHAHGIVHRDLKPANILIKPDGYISLIDFGLARHESTAATWSVLGTPIYMAPELTMSQPGIGTGVDVFASGIILYEMVTKRVPFYGKEEEEVFFRVASNKYKWPRDIRVGKSLKSLVAYLLTHTAVDRPCVAEVKKHPWLSGIVWAKMDGQRYLAPWIPGDVHLTKKWHDRRLPSQAKVPDLHIVVPPEYLRNDCRLPRQKNRGNQAAPEAQAEPPADSAVDGGRG